MYTLVINGTPTAKRSNEDSAWALYIAAVDAIDYSPVDPFVEFTIELRHDDHTIDGTKFRKA